MEKINKVIVKRTNKQTPFSLNRGVLSHFDDEKITQGFDSFVNVYYLEYTKPVFGDYTYDEFTDGIVMVVLSNSRFTNKIVLTTDTKIAKKNSKPSSYHDSEDLCPSCYSPVNIDKDLDDNDCCNKCRPDEPGPSLIMPGSIESIICDMYNEDKGKNGLRPDHFTYVKDVLTGGSITLTIKTNKDIKRNTNFHIFYRTEKIDLNLISMKKSYDMTILNLTVTNTILFNLNDLSNEELLDLEIYETTYD